MIAVKAIIASQWGDDGLGTHWPGTMEEDSTASLRPLNSRGNLERNRIVQRDRGTTAIALHQT